MSGIDKAAYEGDIVSRLKNWRGLHLAHSGDLFEEAAVEIEKLREAIRRLADQDATLSVQGGAVTVTLDATFTPKECIALRDAISFYINEWGSTEDPVVNDSQIIRTLRALLERTK
jgi:hypothetical protein